MKKLILLTLVLGLSLISCKKDEDKIYGKITTNTIWDLNSRTRTDSLTVFDESKVITFTNSRKTVTKGEIVINIKKKGEKKYKEDNKKTVTFSDGKTSLSGSDLKLSTLTPDDAVKIEVFSDVEGVKSRVDFTVNVKSAVSLEKKFENVIVGATANATMGYKVSTNTGVKVDEVNFYYKRVPKGGNASKIVYTKGLPSVTLPADKYTLTKTGAELTSIFSASVGDTLMYALEAKKGSIIDNVTKDSFVFKGQSLEAAKTVVFTDKDSEVDKVTSKREMFYNLTTEKLGNATGHLKVSNDITRVMSGDIAIRTKNFKWGDNKTKSLTFAAEPVQFVKLTGSAANNEAIYETGSLIVSVAQFNASSSKVREFTAAKGDYYYYKVTRHYNKTTDSKKEPSVGN